MLEIGSVVDGKYKILNKVGQGGMSVVYLAMNERANKQWAVKEIRKDGSSDYDVVKQGLIAETDILKHLDHPNLPSIIDVIDRDDTFLIVMDYIEGNPLSKALENYGPQNQEDVIEWGKELCDVLGYLHSRKPPIIYRDMKPANVMLKPDGRVTLIDFGTARTFKETSVEDTRCLGTEGYAAPEQYGGHGQTDARTDIYNLGATLYQLITGQYPRLYEMRPIRYWNPALSSGLEEIILKCTQIMPEDRYQSCEELLYDLEHYNELDIEYRKAENRKWRMFLSSSILAVIFSVGAFGFRSAANVQTRNSYDGYVAAASVAEERQAMEYFKSAINLKPSDETAYQELLKYVTRNNVITSEEDEGIRSIFNETNGTSRSNIEYLRLNNPDAYEVFAYEMGNAYFYTYEEANRKMKSQKWFEAAKSSSSLDVQKRARAECLEKIASYAGTLGVQNQAGDASTTYYDYWLDITSLISSDMISADNNVTALRSYKDFVFNVCTYMEHFLDEGVTQRDISAQLAIVKDAVTAMDVNASNSVEAKLKQATFENINQAVKMLGASGVRTDEKSGEEAQ